MLTPVIGHYDWPLLGHLMPHILTWDKEVLLAHVPPRACVRECVCESMRVCTVGECV